MPAGHIVRANRAADSLFGGVGVREFAACEFPREDIAWVAARTRRPGTPMVAARPGRGRFWRGFGTPPKGEVVFRGDSRPSLRVSGNPRGTGNR
jgi:hypothetical protein